MLDDVEDPKSPTISDQKQTKNIKLMIFRLDQRIEGIEKWTADRTNDDLSVSAKRSGEPTPSLRYPARPEIRRMDSEGQETPSALKAIEAVKALLARHEVSLNEINVRVVDVENTLQSVEPEKMSQLIKRIAELVMQSEKKEVAAAVDDIKGSQMHHAQLVDSIQEEIKLMDERIMQTIKKKIERKELYSTKYQLQKKVR